MEQRSVIRVLVIDDNEADYTLACVNLEAAPGEFRVDHADSLSAAKKALKDCSSYDILLLDLNLGETTELDGLKELRTLCNLPIVIYSGNQDPSLAVQAIEAGAEDYVLKEQVSPSRIYKALQFALAKVRRTLGAETPDRILTGAELRQLLEETRVRLNVSGERVERARTTTDAEGI